MTIRKFFTLTTILFAAFSFVSCSSDDDEEEKKNDVVADKHEYVDLGLPSGTLWATCNVGASKPEEFGDYFAWGEIEPKASYDDNYKWNKDGRYTKYCASSDWGNVDNQLELLPEDDAATANWGSDWCTPSKDQVKELINSDYTTIAQATQNGVDGWKITSKKNGKTLFFPTAGERWYDDFLGNNECCCWTRSVEEKGSIAAYLLKIDEWAGAELRPREEGVTIRPVRVKK